MQKILLQGNEAVAKGAIVAGLDFFAGYPITPSNEVLEVMTHHQEIEVVQMEDEIASVNALVGASLAGAKAMTATSGPGFSLMQEGIGLGHMMQAPFVVVNVMRVGPSTGMPTRPAQGDIMQTFHGSHGDYYPFAFYPNSVSELYRYSMISLNAAEDSMSPVILLSDGFIGHLYETVVLEEHKIKPRPRKFKPLGGGGRHFTGLTHKGNIPRTTNTEIHTSLVMNLKRKQERVAPKYKFYEYLKNKDSDTLIITFGALSRVMYKWKNRFSIFRPITIAPLLEDEIREAVKEHKHVIVAEMSTGQYADLVESITLRRVRRLSVLGGELDINSIGGKLKWITQHG